MNGNFYLLTLLIALLLISCSENNVHQKIDSSNNKSIFLKKSIDNDKMLSHLDSLELEWESLEKRLIGINSNEAFSLFQILIDSNKIFWDFKNYESITVTKSNLDKDTLKEIFLVLDNAKSILLKETQHINDWSIIWEGYENGGAPPKLIASPNSWIEVENHFSCSHCAEDGKSYYKILQNEVRNVIDICWYYDFDYEGSSTDWVLFESASGKFELKNNILAADFHISFKLIGGETTFINDSLVSIIYEWNKFTAKLNPIIIQPIELKPYFLSRYQKEKKSRIHHSNSTVLLAYMDWKRKELLNLKSIPKYKNDILKIEEAYKTTWSELINDWTKEYSFAKR